MTPNRLFRFSLCALCLFLIACNSTPRSDDSSSGMPAAKTTEPAMSEATPEPTPEPLPHESLPVYLMGTDVDQPVDVIERLKAFDCISETDDDSGWAEMALAIDGLQRQAFALDADALVKVTCVQGGLRNGCWETRLCEGEAVRFLSP